VAKKVSSVENVCEVAKSEFESKISDKSKIEQNRHWGQFLKSSHTLKALPFSPAVYSV